MTFVNMNSGSRVTDVARSCTLSIHLCQTPPSNMTGTPETLLKAQIDR